MRHFLFYERISGENFIVGEELFGDACEAAKGIAREIGLDYNGGEFELMFIEELTEEEAEASGYDEY